jgi:hypothetical protein
VILTLADWPGTFDVDIDYRHGSPASYGPNGGDPGDPDEFHIEFVVWEFDGRNSVVVEPKLMDDRLYALLYEAACKYISENGDEFRPDDDTEFYDMQERA